MIRYGYQRPEGILFLHPHPTSSAANILFLFGAGREARERVTCLSPLRTSVSVPDWLVINAKVDGVGAGVIGGGQVTPSLDSY
jgi:hypothetical protein